MPKKKKILLIDDDKDFLFATKIILEKSGYDVFLAEGGKAGVETWRCVAPDLAIVDMMMETWGEGFSVLQKIRATDAGRETPLFILSAVDLRGTFNGFDPSMEFPKVNAVLHKPVKAEELIEHVRMALAEKGPS
jgi:DNA-binding response OmpR family regulator